METFLYITAVGTIILIAFIVYYTLRMAQTRNTVLLVGPCGAGKTAIYHQLRSGVWRDTHTSMKENEDEFVFRSEQTLKPQPKLVHIVDFPGHNRLRTRLQDFYSVVSVFVVDGSEFVASEAADLFYDIITNTAIQKRAVPILIACNKSDKRLAFLRPEMIVKKMEKELDILRKTRNSDLDSYGDGEITHDTQPIGLDDEIFKLEHLANPISTATVSARLPTLDPIIDYVRKVVY